MRCGSIVAGALIASLVTQPAAAGEASGNPVDFQVADLDGAPFSLSSFRGEIVVLDFWAVWCAPCLAAIPALNKIHAARETTGAHVVGVAMYSGGADDVRKLLKKHDSRYTKVMGNEELGEQFGVIGYPTYFLIGPDHRPVGERSRSTADLVGRIRPCAERCLRRPVGGCRECRSRSGCGADAGPPR